MTTRPMSTPVGTPSSRFLPVLLLLFVGSGCAALIYEVVWFQLIELVIGSSGLSLGVLLGTFMGGMCLGSLLLPRFIPPGRHPLRVYAMLEAGIGVFGLLILFTLPPLGEVYSSIASPGASGLILRALFCVVFLLIPTMMMGATLPAIARWVEATPVGVSWLGFFYGSNIAGAVTGCVLAGFYLLRVHDMVYTTWVAVAINAFVAGGALWLAMLAPSGVQRDVAPSRQLPAHARSVYFAIALSGMAALGAEVVWTRLMSLMLGATVYTFSLILAVVLVGLGVGSSAGAWIARVTPRPRAAFGWCQLLVPIAVAWTAWMIARSLPYWPVNPMLSHDPWQLFQFDVMRTAWALLPATLLWGASFPLAIASIATPEQDPGRVVGHVYVANTLGAILGAVGYSVIAIPMFGTRTAEQLLIVISLVAALAVLMPTIRAGEFARKAGESLRIAIVAAVGVLLIFSVRSVPDGLIGYGRMLPIYETLPTFKYVGEGMNSSIAVSELASGYRNFHVSGKVEASSEPQDMRLQRLLGHLSAMAQGDPKSVLIVGFGAGVTSGTFVLYPGIKRIVICELEPLIPKQIAPYFSKENYDVVNDPRVQIVYDDARHFIRTTREKFDIITSDPIHPWVKGAATLYTREYLTLARAHLNPGGVMTEWVPLYESHADAVKSQMATFLDVFPEGTVWANNSNGRGYDVVMLGQATPTVINIDSLATRLSRPENVRIGQSLQEVGFTSLFDVFGGYAGRKADLAPWLADAQINRDRDLRLQYLAGLANNVYENAAIYDSIASYRTFPEQLFVADEAWKNAFSQALGVRR